MTQQFQTQSNVSHEKVNVAAFGWGFVIWGIIYALVWLILSIAIKITEREYLNSFIFWFSIAGLCTGICMVIVGIGFKNKWRYILLAAVPLYIFGLLQFPTGTVIFGWAIRPLWFSRHLFFPFDKNIAEPPSSNSPF